MNNKDLKDLDIMPQNPTEKSLERLSKSLEKGQESINREIYSELDPDLLKVRKILNNFDNNMQAGQESIARHIEFLEKAENEEVIDKLKEYNKILGGKDIFLINGAIKDLQQTMLSDKYNNYSNNLKDTVTHLIILLQDKMDRLTSLSDENLVESEEVKETEQEQSGEATPPKLPKKDNGINDFPGATNKKAA